MHIGSRLISDKHKKGGGIVIDVDEIYSIMGRKRITGTDMAKACGVTPKTWSDWMLKRKMPTDKAEAVINKLQIKDPAKIFFGAKSPDKRQMQERSQRICT